MKKILTIGTLATVFGVGSMFAAQISGGTASAGPTTFDYGDGGGDPTVALTFSQFAGCANCVLTGIEFDVSGTVTDSFSVHNNNAASKTFTVNTSGTIALQDGTSTLTFTETIPTHTMGVTVAGHATSTGSDSASSTAAAIYTVSGTSGALTSYSDTPGSGMGSDLSTPISTVPFLGSGTITLGVLGSFSSTVSGSGNTSTTGGTGSETVTILYDYTVNSTPEPATMTLFGSALLGLGFFARKRIKKS